MPCMLALDFNFIESSSIHKTNRYGESGSPCLQPLSIFQVCLVTIVYDTALCITIKTSNHLLFKSISQTIFHFFNMIIVQTMLRIEFPIAFSTFT